MIIFKTINDFSLFNKKLQDLINEEEITRKEAMLESDIIHNIKEGQSISQRDLKLGIFKNKKTFIMLIQAFVLRSYSGDYTSTFFKYGYVGLDWFQIDPFELKIDISSKVVLQELYRNTYKEAEKREVSVRAGQLLKFINEMTIGSVVVCPYRDGNLLIGTIESDLYFEKDETSHVYWRKKVKWELNNISRSEFSEKLRFSLRSLLPVFTLKNADEILSLMKK